MAADQILVERVRTGLRAAADPTRAPQMQAYMKSAMPYLGVPVPAVRAVGPGRGDLAAAGLDG